VDGADKRTAVPGGPNVGAPPPVVQPVPPPPVVAREKTAPVTPVARPEPQREIIAPPPAASSGFPLALLAIPLFLLLLAGAGVGGWYFFMRSKPETPAVNNPNPPATALSLQYWLETVDKLDNNNNPVGDTKRLADGAMKSSQSFRLHFKAPANGYLYIVGPGENNAPTTFLTAQPMPESGLSTNRILGGADFPFPDGAGNWIGFEPKPGTEVYTVIFAPEPLTEPRFLADQAGKVLDLAQWDDFRAKYKANTATLNVNNSGAEPFVAATASQADKPMLFEIRLEHK
jgi:hypothetical protein